MLKCIYTLLLLVLMSLVKTDATAAEGRVLSTNMLGTGSVALSGNGKVILENIVVANQLILLDTSTFSVRDGAISALSGVISGADMNLETDTTGFGTIKVNGYSGRYTSNITANNVNALINGTIGASITVRNSMLGGRGFMGNVTLESNSVIKPGGLPGTPIGDMYVDRLVAQQSVKHYVEINSDRQASQIYVTDDVLLSDDFTVNVLLKAGTYTPGTTNYPIITSRNGRLITDSSKVLNWTAQTATDGSDLLTFTLGLSDDGTQLVLQSVITAPFTIDNDEVTRPNTRSAAVAANSRLVVNGSAPAPTSTYVDYEVTTSVDKLASIPSNKDLILNGGVLVNDSNATQTLLNSTSLEDISVITTAPRSQTVITGPITSAPGMTLQLNGGGTTTFLSDNSATLQGDVSVEGSTVNVGTGANLGSGNLNLSGEGTTVNLGANSGDRVFLNNIVVVSDPSAFVTSTGATSTFGKEIRGAADLHFSGGGKADLTVDSPDYTGRIYVDSGKVAVNGSMSNTNANIATDGILSGNGTMRDVLLSGHIKPGNSMGALYLNSLTTVSGASYDVEIDPIGNSSQIHILNDAMLNGTFVVNSLMNAGTYPAGIIDYPIMITGGALNIDTLRVRWNAQPDSGLTFTAGNLSDPESAYDQKALILRYNATAPFIIEEDQTEINTVAEVDLINPAFITLNAGDIVARDGILVVPDAPIVTAAPVSDQVELTSIVFQNNPATQDFASTATADAFRSKGSIPAASTSDGKSALQTLLTAIAKSGPVSYERNETRLWISPFVNRSRTNRTSSEIGNQGWSGGSLMGVEQRDKKNIWSLGVLAGLMGSRSHTLGDPNTFSKTSGMLFGAFNTYKYSSHKDRGNFGHEILASRTITSIDAQRYGLDYIDKKTPFYALGSYKSTTDIANAQLNYLSAILILIFSKNYLTNSPGALASHQTTRTEQHILKFQINIF